MLLLDFSKPVTILAPMAGYTDAPMREIVSHYGACAVVSEMMASAEWKTGKSGVKERSFRGNLAENTVFVVQIAGRDPHMVAEVAQYAADLGADQIDINMGCPAKKVVSGATAGASLLLEPKLAMTIVDQTASKISIPVSVKTRLGWEEHTTKHIVSDFEQAGAQMLTIHGRTRNQKYSGHANWRAVGEIKSRAHVPVIVNGDITDLNSAREALELSGADGIMMGRGTIGHPKALAQVRRVLRGEEMGEVCETITRHYEAIIHHYGAELGVRCARKHLKSYFANESPDWLKMLLHENDPDIVLAMIQNQRAAA